MKCYLKISLAIAVCLSCILTADASSKKKNIINHRKPSSQRHGKSDKKNAFNYKKPFPQRDGTFDEKAVAQEKNFATTNVSILSQHPMEELQQLAKLPREELIKEENQEKIAQLTMQITEQQTPAVGRKGVAKAHAEASKIAAELKEVVKEIRAKLLPS